MKNLEWLCNVFFYNLYRWDIVLSSIIQYILSFKWIKYLYLNRRKFYDDRFHILESDSHESILFAQGGFSIINVMVLYSIFNFFQVLIGKSFGHYVYENIFYLILFIVLLTCASFLIDYFFLFRNKKYLSYFCKLDKVDIKKKKKYGYNSFFFILFIICVFFGSFMLLF